MMSLVLFNFARRSVQYLSQAWIMLLICIMYCFALFFITTHSCIPPLGMLHPVLLLYLVATAYLLSIYPLGLCMPGYLQWGRMLGYATPAFILIFIYLIGLMADSNMAHVYTADDIGHYFLSGDVLLRFAALSLSGYYIVNIFRLPHRLVRHMQLPSDLLAYGSALGMVSLLFVALTLEFNLIMASVYLLLQTVVNLFLFFRIMRPFLDGMRYPTFRKVDRPPTQEEITVSEVEDFNEANLHRFEMLEYIMQHDKPYVDAAFNRERLCRLAGFNRHVVLQTLRSQGYNDIHEYISRYRVAELRRLIEAGEVNELKNTAMVGFKTPKTAILCFEKYEGKDLNALLRQHTLPMA